MRTAFLAQAVTAAALVASATPTSSPPPNDECVAATVIPASPTFPFYDFVSNVTAATTNGLDPYFNCNNGGSTVWYTWSPSVSGRFDFSMVLYPPEQYGTYQGVFLGTSCGSLVEVACLSVGALFRIDVEAGRTYYIIVGVVGSGAAHYDLTYTIYPTPPPPSNDECGAATVIPASPIFPFVDVISNIFYATINGLDPFLNCNNNDDFNTVWFTWTPSVGGRYDFVVDGDLQFRTVQGAYVGSCDSLIEVDSDCSSYGLRFGVIAGETYNIKMGVVVSGANPGDLTYTINPSPPPPPNDECANATVIPASPTFPFIDVVSNVDTATPNALDPVLTCGRGDGGSTVWYSWSPSLSGRYDFSTDRNLPQYLTYHGVFLGTSCGSLVEVQCLPGGALFRLEVNAGETYFIIIDLVGSGANFGNLTYTINYAPPPPPNDECVNATVVPASPTFPFIDLVINVTFAYPDALDPSLNCSYGSDISTVWYTWTPSVSGRFDFLAADDAQFSTVQSAYVGSCRSRVEVARECLSYGLRFDVTAGETYFIKIGVVSSFAALGDLTYTISPTPPPPPNDECANATIILASPTSPFVDVVVYVTSATVNALDPRLKCGFSEYDSSLWYSSVWYTWTPSVGGRFDFVTKLDTPRSMSAQGAFVGSCGGSLAAVACDNGSGLRFDVTAGETYLIKIDVSFAGISTGNLAYNILPSPLPPSNDECVDAIVIPSLPSFPYENVVDNATFASSSVLDPKLTCIYGYDGTSAVWYAWTPYVSGQYNFHSFKTNVVTVSGVFVGDCGSLDEVACWELGSGVESLRFEVTAGNSYYIKVGIISVANADVGQSVKLHVSLTESSDVPKYTDPPTATSTAPVAIAAAPFAAPAAVALAPPIAAPVEVASAPPIAAPAADLTATTSGGRGRACFLCSLGFHSGRLFRSMLL